MVRSNVGAYQPQLQAGTNLVAQAGRAIIGDQIAAHLVELNPHFSIASAAMASSKYLPCLMCVTSSRSGAGSFTNTVTITIAVINQAPPLTFHNLIVRGTVPGGKYSGVIENCHDTTSDYWNGDGMSGERGKPCLFSAVLYVRRYSARTPSFF
jgi:hypothetical protein